MEYRKGNRGQTSSDQPAIGLRQTVLEPFLLFLRLGLTSFGGPIAHLGYFRQEFVDGRKWLTEQAFVDLVALCQFLPGPTSSQVAYSIGMTRGGIAGAIAAWGAFTLPSAVIMLLAAYGIHWIGHAQSAPWLHGLKVVAVAVVAQAVWSMAIKLCTDRTRTTLAFAAAVIILLTDNAWMQVLTIALGALAGWKLIQPGSANGTGESFPRLPSRFQSVISLTLFAFCLLLLPFLAAGHRDGWLPLFDSFYRSGSLVFGGGHVVLPLLQAEVVPKGWEDNNTFLAGYGIAQALPGPLFSFAAYLGAAKSGYPSGWPAGLWCLFAILLPPILLVTGLLPVWNRLRASPSAQALLAGANAAVVGILLAALYQPIWTSAIDSAKSLALALVLFAGLQFWKIAPWILVLIGAVLGTLFL
ncbi:MAG TPA: chromate efflux transporter [Chthoniobacterales bacterium]|jgi:chromate transporter|nr:chromate efflux transporter [Chthoniobacterales bacterium]